MAAHKETTEYNKLFAFTQKVVDVAKKSNGFVSSRSPYAYHILFDQSEMSFYFDLIRNDLAKGQAGRQLTKLLASGAINVDSSNNQIWSALMQSLEFSGIDFEHAYKILPSKADEAEDKFVWDYTFEETIVLSHTLLMVPVMQHYGPLTPKLDLQSTTKKFEQAKPLLVVGMIGDCVKGKFFEQIKQMAEQGDKEAKYRIGTLLNPQRLQQKMCGLVRALLLAREESGVFGLRVDSCLVGSGAFGGNAKTLAQPFVDSLNGGDMPFHNSLDEVNFFMFPPPKQPDELTLESMRYKVSLNSKKGLGSAPEAADNVVRVVVAGFDPISLTPHGLMNRVFSAEGQLSHATDLLYRITSIAGKFLSVQVPKGSMWESPKDFFAQPQVPKYKEEDAYDTVRFVPESVLKDLGIKEGQEACVQLVASERVAPRVWNGDSFEGWVLSHGNVRGKTWEEIINSSPQHSTSPNKIPPYVQPSTKVPPKYIAMVGAPKIMATPAAGENKMCCAIRGNPHSPVGVVVYHAYPVTGPTIGHATISAPTTKHSLYTKYSVYGQRQQGEQNHTTIVCCNTAAVVMPRWQYCTHMTPAPEFPRS